ncbi:MAG: hypothetical protein ABSB40_07230 [Nitrososphaeria archaeon]|jgi:hypothetical protein
MPEEQDNSKPKLEDIALELERLLKEGKLPSGRSPEEHQQFLDELRKSADLLGHIHPVLRTQFGIAAGSSRLEADPNWPVVDVPVKNPYNYYRLMAGDNQREDKTEEWWKAVVILSGYELMKRGLKPGEITKRLEKDFPISGSKLRQLLPDELKDANQSERAKQGVIERKAAAFDKDKEKKKADKAKKKEERERKRAEKEAKGQFVRYRIPSDARVSIEETTPTETENIIVSKLVYLGIKYIPSAVFKSKDGDVYVIPIYIEKGGHAIGLDVEGSSASRDEEARLKFFQKRGIPLVWVPKECAEKYSDVLAEVIKVTV